MPYENFSLHSRKMHAVRKILIENANGQFRAINLSGEGRVSTTITRLLLLQVLALFML